MTRRTRHVVWFVWLVLSGCTKSPPPSFVLAVLDTARADAVSAYGKVAGTTPTVDALAQTGLRYTHAYSNSNWTLPAHASLFTGLLLSEHGLRLGSDALPNTVTTLAEQLRGRGYETVAFSENPWLGPAAGVTRGFDRFTGPSDRFKAKLKREMSELVGEWLASRPRDRPFFLFLNIMDPHWDYQVRAANPFLPPGVSRERASAIATSPPLFCVWRRGSPEADILRGLYLGDVQAADAKLGRVLRRLREAPAQNSLVVIVTSDHGEYLGEQGLLEHGVGMGEAVLEIPLIVHGLPRVPAAVIDEPVQLIDIMPSVLSWAGAPVPAGLTGRRLPTTASAERPSRPIIAEYWDAYTKEQTRDLIRDVIAWRRKSCTAEDKVFGDTHAILRFPYKLISYERYAAELFDVRADPEEQHDLAAKAPEAVAALQAELHQVVTAARPPSEVPKSTLDASTAERLRALGYAAAGGP